MSSAACPICGIMINLGQLCPNLSFLNTHLDQFHPAESPDAAEMFFSWIKSTQTKVIAPFKNNQLLDKLDKKLQGTIQELAGFEPLELNMTEANVLDPTMDTDSLITKNHWEPELARTVCWIQDCDKPLGLAHGRHHCYRCGRLTCELHSRFQMRLAKDARHDPNGFWYRVCYMCYISRDGYAVGLGVSRQRTSFLTLRAQMVAQTSLKVNMLEKRVDKLMQCRNLVSNGSVVSTQSSATALLQGSQSDVAGGLNLSENALGARFSELFLGKKPFTSQNFRQLSNEVMTKSQSVSKVSSEMVPWTRDDYPHCQVCQEKFGMMKRRHHCRLCGLLICQSCSRLLDKVETRICSVCRGLLDLRRFKENAADNHEINELYQVRETHLVLFAV